MRLLEMDVLLPAKCLKSERSENINFIKFIQKKCVSVHYCVRIEYRLVVISSFVETC